MSFDALSYDSYQEYLEAVDEQNLGEPMSSSQWHSLKSDLINLLFIFPRLPRELKYCKNVIF